MLYHLYEAQRALMEPFSDFAQVAAKLFANPRDRKSTRLNSSHIQKSRMPSSA